MNPIVIDMTEDHAVRVTVRLSCPYCDTRFDVEDVSIDEPIDDKLDCEGCGRVVVVTGLALSVEWSISASKPEALKKPAKRKKISKKKHAANLKKAQAWSKANSDPEAKR